MLAQAEVDPHKVWIINISYLLYSQSIDKYPLAYLVFVPLEDLSKRVRQD